LATLNRWLACNARFLTGADDHPEQVMQKERRRSTLLQSRSPPGRLKPLTSFDPLILGEGRQPHPHDDKPLPDALPAAALTRRASSVVLQAVNDRFFTHDITGRGKSGRRLSTVSTISRRRTG